MKHLLFLLLFAATSSFAQEAPLAPSHEQKISTLEIVQKLQNSHYQKHTIDDAFSKEFLANYLKTLDANHQVFLQKDIDAFYKKYADVLDDQLKKGNSEAGFVIFNQFRAQHIQLLQKSLADLATQIKAFKYDKNDSIETDRSKAAWPKTEKERALLWHQRLKAAALSLKLADKKTDDIIDLLTKRYQNQLKRIQQLRAEDVYQLYMNAFTALYDPHTNYFSPQTSENFDITMSLKLEGIGAVLSIDNEYTQIVRLIHAGPAQKEGNLKPTDKIIAVGQGKTGKMVDVVGWRLDDVVKLIRGPKGSTVRLQVIPGKAITEDDKKIISIVRDEVKLEEQSVQKAMLDIKDKQGISHKIGVLNIPAFYIDFEALRNRDPNFKSTTRDTAKLLTELIRDGAEGIVIDLRNNGGGSLREANELTGLFIEKGPSVQIRTASGQIYPEGKSYYAPYYDGPLVILINRLSASASEIFSGAMQDYDRALIVGSTSFGKGTVQSLIDLSHGKLKLTQSKFYRISGASTQDRGVSPDINLPAIFDASKIGENSLEHALPWDTVPQMQHALYYDFKPLLAPLRQQSANRVAKNPDFIYIEKTEAYEKSHRPELLSLNQKVRLKERQQDKAALLDLLNEKRQAKGQKPLDKLEEEDEEEKNKDAGLVKIDLEDPYLKEAANIMLDLKTLLGSKVLAKAQ